MLAVSNLTMRFGGLRAVDETGGQGRSPLCHSRAVFDHVTIRASDRAASERFYALVLRTIGVEPTHSGGHFAEWRDFSLAAASDEKPVTRGLHIGFSAPSRADIEEFWRVGTGAGYRDDGRPGPRPQYGDTYYGGFLLDPDGNSAEAVHHDSVRADGYVDHLWLRVADVDASRRFYEVVGAHAGFALRRRTAERAQFVGSSGSFSVVAGGPLTEHVPDEAFALQEPPRVPGPLVFEEAEAAVTV